MSHLDFYEETLTFVTATDAVQNIDVDLSGECLDGYFWLDGELISQTAGFNDVDITMTPLIRKKDGTLAVPGGTSARAIVTAHNFTTQSPQSWSLNDLVAYAPDTSGEQYLSGVGIRITVGKGGATALNGSARFRLNWR